LATREEKFWQRYKEEKAAQQMRKQAPKPPKTGRVRRKDWLLADVADLDLYDELDLPERERVMPRGEQERRRANLATTAVQPAPADHRAATPGAAAESSIESENSVGKRQRGIVVEVSAGLCRVNLGERMALCTVRSTLKAADTGYTNVVAVGDEVMVSVNGAKQGIVEKVLPRRSALARPDVFYGHLQQVIAANVDQLLIVASWREPAIWPELIDRYLIGAERNRLTPIICINKIDLADDPRAPEKKLTPYTTLGVRVLFTSAQTRVGLDALREVLHGKTSALAGLSGVGKSSLLSAVEPGLNLRTADVSDRRHEGRHTTAQVTLHPLSTGGFVVDTPGIREFGLSGLRQSELVRFYAEIAAQATRCRFADCSHTREPGCAVKLAVRQGRISEMRYQSYRKIYRDLEA